MHSLSPAQSENLLIATTLLAAFALVLTALTLALLFALVSASIKHWRATRDSLAAIRRATDLLAGEQKPGLPSAEVGAAVGRALEAEAAGRGAAWGGGESIAGQWPASGRGGPAGALTAVSLPVAGADAAAVQANFHGDGDTTRAERDRGQKDVRDAPGVSRGSAVRYQVLPGSAEGDLHPALGVLPDSGGLGEEEEEDSALGRRLGRKRRGADGYSCVGAVGCE
ncbi:hypothetical protein LTR08_006112 [Meristemomyces frigidus]|nr:hypothetical protein LTR08_006112 [Meristemomyces frigidus]